MYFVSLKPELFHGDSSNYDTKATSVKVKTTVANVLTFIFARYIGINIGKIRMFYSLEI